MRHRFETSYKNTFLRNALISIAVFVLIIFVFYHFIGSVSSRTVAEQEKTLESALTRCITHCYAVEGYYPESLDYLKENYGLTYNEDLFYIDYQPLGSDIMPDTTIIVRKGENP
jgi:hypothetical protein